VHSIIYIIYSPSEPFEEEEITHCGYMVREMHRRREMTRFNLVGDRFAGKKRVSALRTAMVLSMQNVVGAFTNKISNFTNKSYRSFTPVMRWPTTRVQLRCFYRVDLSFYVHTTARVQLRWFWLREIGFSVHTTTKANCDGPTAMLLPRMRKHARLSEGVNAHSSYG
jgi:hypothetical protein